MKNSVRILFGLLVLMAISGCKKTNSDPPANMPPSLFHRDITIHETVGNMGEPPQSAIGLFQLASDTSQLVFAASRGIYELETQGFRMVGLSKDSSVNWIKSYYLPAYSIQYTTCSAIDQQDNIFIGGHGFDNVTNYGRPFLVKLDKTGNILWSSVLHDSAHTSRGIAIKTLRKGDIAYLTSDSYGLNLFRLSSGGNLIWSKYIGSDSMVFEPSVYTYQLKNYNSHMLAEASDGSIFFACNSNQPVAGKDCLFKFSANGDLVFAKTYTWPNPITAFPPQIQITENDQVIYTDQKNMGANGYQGYPYMFVISSAGDIITSKAFPLDYTPSSWNSVNELNYFQKKIYITTSGDYEFNTYVFDLALNELSGIKTLGTNNIATDYGGLSTYDKGTNSLLHILNIAGMSGDGNGFQFFRTDMQGTSCHQYTIAVNPMTMSAVTGVVKDITPTITDGSRAFSETLQWATAPVSITSSEIACFQ